MCFFTFTLYRIQIGFSDLAGGIFTTTVTTPCKYKDEIVSILLFSINLF